MVLIDLDLSTVYRDEVVVDTKAVTLRVAVRKQPTLQETIGTKSDTGHHMCRCKGGLFNFSKIVLGIVIQFQNTYLNKRILRVTPDFGDIKWVLIMIFCLFFGHDLHIHCPFGEVSAFNCLIEILAVVLSVHSINLCSFLI